MEFMSYAGNEKSPPSTVLHDPTILPADLPAPPDDGAARHLPGTPLPDLRLDGDRRHVGESLQAQGPHGRLHISAHGPARAGAARRLGRHSGARGCTPQSCAFRDHFAELTALGVEHLFGLSTQDTDYQREAVARLHLPFPILSDEKLAFARALNLPTFDVAGMTLLKRMALVIDDGVVMQVFYPVFPPDKCAETVRDWLRAAPEGAPPRR